MNRAALVLCLLPAVACGQTVYRVGNVYTDKPSPEAAKVYIVLNIVQAEDVPLFPAWRHVPYVAPVAPPAPAPPVTVININVKTVVQPVYPQHYGHHFRRTP